MQINYSLKELKALNIEEGSKIPIFCSFLADTETPISLYKKLKSIDKYSFLFESAEQGEKTGRYSFLGFKAQRRIVFDKGEAKLFEAGKTKKIKTQNPLKLIEDELNLEKVIPSKDLPRFQGGFIGYISYDCVKYFDKIKLPKKSLFKHPEIQFILPETVLIYDNQQRKLFIVTYIKYEKAKLAANLKKATEVLRKIKQRIEKPVAKKLLSLVEKKEITANSPKQKVSYEAKVKKALKKVRQGETFQVVLSEQFTRNTPSSNLDIYRKMREINPSPYMYLLDFDDLAVIGSSPETLVQVEKRQAMLRPIAGTRPRGKDLKEDKALEKDLLKDVKEIAEHKMLVDLARNDLGRVAEKGKVTVKNFMTIKRYSHVMHIVSDVYAKLDADKTIFDAFKSCFPAGTLSGAPKIRAMQIISDLEDTKRGIYGGAVGYFDFSGNMDFAIAIRTIVKQGKKACAQAGAGIVFDSVPANEFQECLNKASSSLSTIS